ncbi:hypothetical protein [Streptomyces sp. NBC_00842]|uniref:hypothetical protein n=1 Tax=Streptomyces sp. NBC_00842 TaxID=2975848 RepID=UPI003862E458|nr:hypothetical protein OH821_17065 [Streptomyces sp. NBC_00842]
MTDRIPLDDLTSDQLDALYERAEQAEADLLGWKKLLQKSREMTAAHWAAIERAQKLATQWAVLRAYGGAATELRAALAQPQQCPQCGDSGACNGGPCPLAALDQPPPTTPTCRPGPYDDCPNCHHEQQPTA